jgi:hypothetical protein
VHELRQVTFQTNRQQAQRDWKQCSGMRSASGIDVTMHAGAARIPAAIHSFFHTSMPTPKMWHEAAGWLGDIRFGQLRHLAAENAFSRLLDYWQS